MASTTYDEIIDKYAGTQAAADGSFTTDQIERAAVVVTAKAARRCAAALETIVQLLNNLGADGIHTVIRAEAAHVRKTEKAARARRLRQRRARAAAKAVPS